MHVSSEFFKTYTSIDGLEGKKTQLLYVRYADLTKS